MQNAGVVLSIWLRTLMRENFHKNQQHLKSVLWNGAKCDHASLKIFRGSGFRVILNLTFFNWNDLRKNFHPKLHSQPETHLIDRMVLNFGLKRNQNPTHHDHSHVTLPLRSMYRHGMRWLSHLPLITSLVLQVPKSQNQMRFQKDIDWVSCSYDLEMSRHQKPEYRWHKLPPGLKKMIVKSQNFSLNQDHMVTLNGLPSSVVEVICEDMLWGFDPTPLLDGHHTQLRVLKFDSEGSFNEPVHQWPSQLRVLHLPWHFNQDLTPLRTCCPHLIELRIGQFFNQPLDNGQEESILPFTLETLIFDSLKFTHRFEWWPPQLRLIVFNGCLLNILHSSPQLQWPRSLERLFLRLSCPEELTHLGRDLAKCSVLRRVKLWTAASKKVKLPTQLGDLTLRKDSKKEKYLRAGVYCLCSQRSFTLN